MVLERSTSPASCRAPAPAVATAMASSHMRMRFQSPMLTTSDTAPMVQKRVLLPTAPKRKASANAPHTTAEASTAGLDSVKRPRFGWPGYPAGSAEIGRRRLFFLQEALLRLLGRRAGGIFLDEGAQRLARGRALSQLPLGARDVEQRIGRLGILRPELDHFLLGGDGGLVIAHGVVSVADPVLRRGKQLAAGEIGHEILEARDGELIVAELELVERQLVRLFFRGGTALALAQLVLQLSLRLLELSQAVVEVDVEILLAPLQRLGLVREHLDRPAQLRYVLLQRFDQLGEVDDAVLARRIQRSKPRVDRREALLDGLLARLDLVPQLEDLLARLVVVEKGGVGRAREERGPKRKRDPQPHRSSIRRCRACRCGGSATSILRCDRRSAVFPRPG